MKTGTLLWLSLTLVPIARADNPTPVVAATPAEPAYAIAISLTRFLSAGATEGFDLKCPQDEKLPCEARELRGQTAKTTTRIPLGDAQKILHGFSSKLPPNEVHPEKDPKLDPAPENSVVIWSVEAKGNYSRGFIPPPNAQHKLEPLLKQRMKAIIFLESRLRNALGARH